MKKLALVVILSFILAGCAKLNSTAMSYTPPVDKSGNLLIDGEGEPVNAQRLFLWKSNYSAGISTKDGVCAQSALTAFSSNIGSDSGKIAGVSIPKLVSDSKVTKLRSSTAQTAFANASLFYLCQIALNTDDLKSDDIVNMWKDTNQTIRSIADGNDLEATTEEASETSN